MSEEKIEFQAGDIVDDHGLKMTIEKGNGASSYPLIGRADNGQVESYTLDGRPKTSHTIPSLKLVERPVKYEPFIRWVNVYPDNLGGSWRNKNKAMNVRSDDSIEMVNLIYHRNADGTIERVEMVR